MGNDNNNPSALSHLKVLDLSRILAGPWATQALADLGADVIKIEHPRGGDDTRRWGPPFMETSAGQDDAAYFTSCNRNKQSVTIDFSKPEGADLVRQLAADSDIVVENYKLGGLTKYGLDYESLKVINPGLVYCSITGFGQTGPYAQRAGYDFLIQGMGGLMSITGQPDGSPGAEPVKVGVAVTDLFTGMYAAVSILAAITHREKTGEGQHIECSLLSSQVSMLANQASNWLVGGLNPARMGNNHPSIVPYSVFPTSDGHVIIACGNDEQFQRLGNALDLIDVVSSPDYSTNANRVQHREQLVEIIASATSLHSKEELITKLEAVSVPCGPINEICDVFNDPHVQDRELEVKIPRPDGTMVSTVAYPANLSATPASYRSAPAPLGIDTETVLTSRLNLDSSQIKSLRDNGITHFNQDTLKI